MIPPSRHNRRASAMARPTDGPEAWSGADSHRATPSLVNLVGCHASSVCDFSVWFPLGLRVF